MREKKVLSDSQPLLVHPTSTNREKECRALLLLYQYTADLGLSIFVADFPCYYLGAELNSTTLPACLRCPISWRAPFCLCLSSSEIQAPPHAAPNTPAVQARPDRTARATPSPRPLLARVRRVQPARSRKEIQNVRQRDHTR